MAGPWEVFPAPPFFPSLSRAFFPFSQGPPPLLGVSVTPPSAERTSAGFLEGPPPLDFFLHHGRRLVRWGRGLVSPFTGLSLPLLRFPCFVLFSSFFVPWLGEHSAPELFDCVSSFFLLSPGLSV